MGDISYPLGKAINDMAGQPIIPRLKAGLQEIIHRRFYLPWPLPSEWEKSIAEADRRWLITERNWFLNTNDLNARSDDEAWLGEPEPYDEYKWAPLNSIAANRLFTETAIRYGLCTRWEKGMHTHVNV